MNSINKEKPGSPSRSGSSRKAWSVQGDPIAAMKKYANKYSILNEYDNNEDYDGNRHEEGIESVYNDVLPDKNVIVQGMKNDIVEAWKNGDIFEKVKELREELKVVQIQIDKNPNNKILREGESRVLHEYNAAMSDEEKLMFQKAKIKWLSVGDRNNAYFHRILKSRNHRNRVNAVHDEEGRRFKGDKVGDQFVKHFKHFLGESVHVIMEITIEELSSVSGLLPNYNKSTILFGSVKEEDRQSILSVNLFRVEKLLVKYHGVPLISKWIRVKDFVIKEINSLLKGFLWNQDEKANGRAKVAWKNLCKPKSQGGLGHKNLSSWNKVLIIKHLWHIAIDKNTMWVRCINTFKLKGRSLWEINEDVNDSWGWRNILRIRQE
nr:RNA-directed DNA polymerase, eukaryota, reverse transcriptase zinc-binding domain protein [Tanacetum cinerariifolium]